MIEPIGARAFAGEWISAWNAHDMARLLSHYPAAYDQHSPLIIARMGDAERNPERQGRYSALLADPQSGNQSGVANGRSGSGDVVRIAD